MQTRTKVTAWFGVVVFAYYYKALVCGVLSHTFGVDLLCEPLIRNISVNHWIEILVYCPLLWLALHQVNSDVFGGITSDAAAARTRRRQRLVGEAAAAAVFYGTGVHIANVVEIASREQIGVADGELYDLVYFLDEGLSHYLQFVPLFFVIGWFVICDRPGRTDWPTVAVFFGVGHGVERAIGIIEGGKWFLGPPTVLWFAIAVVIRVRLRARQGGDARGEFFVRYAVAFCLAHPVAQLLYRLRFGAFDQPSSLTDARLAELGGWAVALSVTGTALIVWLDRRREHRRPVTVPTPDVHPSFVDSSEGDP